MSTIQKTATATPRMTIRPARPVKSAEPTVIPKIKTIAAVQTHAKKRVAGYARVSTEFESQEGSYALQCQHYADYIGEHEDWTMVKVYADEGKTGTSTRQRTEFRQMIADAEAGKIDLIITKSISRFARNTVDCLETVRKLKNLPKPVGVYFEKENIDSLDGKSELILTILSSLAQDESRSISENIRWSFQKLYEQGQVNCSTARLLGYDTVRNPKTGERKVVIEPVGASVVKMIYEEFLAGRNYTQIAHHMELLGAKTGAGKSRWNTMAVRRILENEKYKGDAISHKEYTTDFLNHTKIKNEGQRPMYISEGHHEPIIDRETWDIVQARIAKSAGAERRAKMSAMGSAPHRSTKTIFSSKLFCGDCKALLIRRSMAASACSADGSRIPIWKCRNSEGRGNKSCHSKAIPEIVLEQTFMAMLAEMSARPREELEMEFRLANGLGEPVEPENADELRLELDTVQNQIDAMSADPDLYDDMLEALEAKKLELERELSGAPDWTQISPLKLETFNWFLEQLDTIKPYDPDKTTIPFRPDIYQRCVERGDVREVKEKGELKDIAIRYTFTFGLEVTAHGNHRTARAARKIAETSKQAETAEVIEATETDEMAEAAGE